MDLLSRSEELIMLAIWRLQKDAYGLRILEHLSETTGRDWAIGAIYVPLDRLAKRGYVTDHWGEPTPQRGGRSKRFYRLTATGVSALNELRHIQNTMWEGLPAFE